MDRAARIAVALVWLYNGLWCKLLARCAGHARIIAEVAVSLAVPARALGVAIGLGEVAIAIWVLAGRQRRAAAWTQTAILVAMNGLGLLLAGAEIPAPGGMLVHNSGAAAWRSAARRRPA